MSSKTSNKGTLSISDDLPVCLLCACQYDIPESGELKACRLCEDPRSVLQPSGHAFSTARKLREDPVGYHLRFEQEEDSHVWHIQVEPQFGIGQRAYLIQTPDGNILWDMVGYLDQGGVDKINELGGLKFIIISHPHFYANWPDWARTFGCPIYLAEADKEWLNRKTPPDVDLRLLTDQYTELMPGVTAILAGGHFDGSMMLHVTSPALKSPSLFHADTICIVPTADQPDPTRPGVLSFSFMWSIPNMIPLPPDKILTTWLAIKGRQFQAAYGVLKTLRDRDLPLTLPQRVLDSAKMFVRHMGYVDHPILWEEA